MALIKEKEKYSFETVTKIEERDRPFSKINYLLMCGCLVLIILGFILMSGGGSTVEEGFNPEIFSARRIIVGPLLSFLGFFFMAFAIIYKGPKRNREEIQQVNEQSEE